MVDTQITDAMLKEWEGLCERATPGDWLSIYDDNGFWFVTDEFGERPSPYVAATGGEGDENEANAEFIAAARTALPLLLAEVRRLRTQGPDYIVRHERPEGEPTIVEHKSGK